MKPSRIDRVDVTLKTGQKGKGRTLRAAILNAWENSKCLSCGTSKAHAWENRTRCEASQSGVHEWEREK